MPKSVKSRKITNLCKFALDIVLPNRCPFCRDVIPWNKNACDNCASELKYSDNPLRDLNDSLLCVSPCEYDGVAKQAVLNFKYDSATNAAQFFAPKLSELVLKYFGLPDIVTCVPATRKTLSERGYNQAALIAKSVADELSLLCDCKLLAKKNNSYAQHTLSYNERIINAENTYYKGKSNRSLKGLNVLLCDDVVTTGATLRECASTLKKLGAENVYCCTLTKTPDIKRKENENSV